MVCRYDDAWLLLVLQTDHSRVAGLLAAHWGNARFVRPRPYASVVLAAQEHDGGWWDWEVRPTLDARGYPPDYIGSIRHLGPSTWLDFYRAGIERVAQRDPYAGLLVLMHGEGLLTQGKGLLPYMPDYSADPPVAAFLEERGRRRQELLAQLRASDQYREVATDEHLWTNFKYLEVFDQMAQFVCNRYPFNSTERKNGPSSTLSDVPVPVAPGEPDVTLTIDVQDETRAVVRPYPFDLDPLPIRFEARLVPNRPYASQEEFLRAFYPAQRLTLTYTLHAA